MKQFVRFSSRVALSAAVALLGTAGTVAHGQTMHRSAKKSTLSATDRNFIMTAARAGEEEVMTGGIARDRGTEPVKQFGSKMVDDHSAANAKLKSIAVAKG